MTQQTEDAKPLGSEAAPEHSENCRLSLGHWVSIIAVLMGLLGALSLWLLANLSNNR